MPLLGVSGGVVLGPRRVGKTSLVNVAINELGVLALRLNLVRLRESGRVRYSRDSFVALLPEEVARLVRAGTLVGRVVRFVANVLGVDEDSVVNFSSFKLRVRLRRFRAEDVGGLLRELDGFARDNRRRLVVVLDEAQELGRVMGIDFPSLLQDVYDYCTNTVIVMTGSMVGIMEGLLRGLEYGKPFFGRYMRRIYLGRFSEDESREFLRMGFREEGLEVGDDVINNAVNRLDRVVGWLTLFGAEYVNYLRHGVKPNIENIVAQAIEEVREEFRNFLLTTQSAYRYAAITLALGRLGGRARLGEVVEVAGTLINEEIPRSRVYEILSRLVDYGFIERVNDEYLLPKDESGRVGMLRASEGVLGSLRWW
ncbi:ATP-binding protein [Vulcanisaeta sp. JCM 16161]|uniref:AAA family ATPase n=1 Tax=Vulcanisaeta sp. JCM 16161 TaxID=1295372 RepID=UPI000A633263|nr:ATP-binding protein [Vulcanisaeta sp. JCM 16161]